MAERRFNFRYVLAIPGSGVQKSMRDAAGRLTLPSRRTVSDTAIAFGEDPPSTWPGADIAVIPWAAEIRWDNPAATAVTMTASSWVTERHPGGFRVRDVTISGEIDYLASKDARVAAMIAGLNQKGRPLSELSEQERIVLPAAFRTILEAIELCERVAADPRLELHLYSFDEGRYYLVEPRGTSQLRSLRNRLGWHYEFHFTALAKVTPPKLEAIPRALPKASKKNWFDKTIDSIRSATAGFQKGIDLVRADVKWAETQVNRIIDAGEDIVATMEDAARLVVTLKNAPMRIFTHLKAVENRFRSLLLTFTGGLEPAARKSAGSVGAGDRIDAIPNAANRASVSAARSALLLSKASEDAFYTAVAAARIGALRSTSLSTKMRIGQRDTLEGIALSLFGDAAKWNILADLNGLRYPYIARAGGIGILRPGDELILPDTLSGSTGTFADPTGADMDERIFGRGIKLTDAGDWKKSADSKGVDTVVGTDCVKQGLRIRFGTEEGTNPIAPTMGLPAILGEEASEGSVQAYSVAALWQANRDDRVRSVRSFSTTQDGNVLGFDAVAELVTQQDLSTGTGG